MIKDIIELRNYFRKNPELGSTSNTLNWLSTFFQNLGWEIEKKTGLVVTLPGERQGKLLAFKANTDAVPVQDDVNPEIRSTIPGISHTCGHAGEMAILLGAAITLSEIPTNERKTIKFIFNPNEERIVHPESFAKKMVDESAIEGIDAIIEMHPTTICSDQAMICPLGRFNAASDRIKIEFFPSEEKILDGTMIDANTFMSILTAEIEETFKPDSIEDEGIMIRTPFHECFDLKKTYSNDPETFIISLKGPGGHAGVSKDSPNLNLIAAKIVNELHENYKGEIFTYVGSYDTPSYNSLATMIELMASFKKKAGQDEIVKKIVTRYINNLPVEHKIEKMEDTFFSSHTKSFSTIRIANNDFEKARKMIAAKLKEVLFAKAKKYGIPARFEVVDQVRNGEIDMACQLDECVLHYQIGTNPTFNSKALVKLIKQAAGKHGITEFIEKPVNAGSDFHFMKTPNNEIAIIVWGCVSKEEYALCKKENIGHHHPKFFENDRSLINCSKVIVQAIRDYWEA